MGVGVLVGCGLRVKGGALLPFQGLVAGEQVSGLAVPSHAHSQVTVGTAEFARRTDEPWPALVASLRMT